MVTIIFESHATTVDNAAHISSGHFDAELSSLGLQQAKELGRRYTHDSFDAIFCSNLKRSLETARLAFEDRGFTIISDSRLAECDYGQYNGHPSAEVEHLRPRYVTTPFPGGQSYEQTTGMVKEFLKELRQKYDGKRVMIIGHRATQYGLEHVINHTPLVQAISAPWKWRPGWIYILQSQNFIEA